jgi:hypothetical protein
MRIDANVEDEPHVNSIEISELDCYASLSRICFFHHGNNKLINIILLIFRLINEV